MPPRFFRHYCAGFVHQRRAESEAMVEAVREIGRIGHDNGVAVDHTALAVENLLRFAGRLEENVSRFKLTKEKG